MLNRLKCMGGVVMVVAALGLAGCTQRAVLTQQQAFEQYPVVQELKSALEKAKKEQVDVLAPGLYQEAKSLYGQAYDNAVADKLQGEVLAQKGHVVLTQATNQSVKARDILEASLEARRKALEAKADEILVESFKEADRKLTELGALVEANRVAQARSKQPTAMKVYQDLELSALKGSLLDQAKAAIEYAGLSRVDQVAPITLRRAKDELKLAENILEADRTSVERAQRHANLALQYAKQSQQIAELLEQFKQEGLTKEQLILWHQNQVAEIVRPLGLQPGVDRPNKVMISALVNEVSEWSRQQQMLAATVENTKAEADAFSEQSRLQIEELKAESEAERQRQQALDQKYRFISSLFNEQEAQVYQKIDDVLIRAHGFYFPVGGSEIETQNYALLDKIIQSIKQFPESNIVVSGHTDSLGDSALNRRLSQARAEAVKKFLVEIGHLPAESIRAVGYGKEQPVASNETAEGRAANRRVQVLIVN